MEVLGTFEKLGDTYQIIEIDGSTFKGIRHNKKGLLQTMLINKKRTRGMKVGNARIRNNKIEVNTKDHFEAIYKKRQIYVSSDHGFGEALFPNLETRYYIAVWDWESGMHDYDGYIDLPNIKMAIEEALIGSCLMPEAKQLIK